MGEGAFCRVVRGIRSCVSKVAGGALIYFLKVWVLIVFLKQWADRYVL